MSSSPTDPFSRHTLILESPKGLETMDLARRVREINAPMTVVSDFDEVAEVLSEGEFDVGAVLVPTHYAPDVVRTQMNRLSDLAPKDGMHFVSVGNMPERAVRKKLRKAGMKLALWNPLSEAMLRFQLNRAQKPGPDGLGKRDNPRVPTQLGCSVRIADRVKDTVLYSLAETGAFLSTHRAIMNGARVELKLHLPDSPIETMADVVYANVPGNLQRPGLPLGMGVRFDPLPRADLKRLRSFIAACIEQLEV